MRIFQVFVFAVPFTAARRSNVSTADAQLRAVRAREIDIRVAEHEKKLMPIAEAIAALDIVIGAVLAELSSLAPAVTRDLALQWQIEEKIFAMGNRISKRLAAQASSLREVGKAAA